jgi:hypothetical protein
MPSHENMGRVGEENRKVVDLSPTISLVTVNVYKMYINGILPINRHRYKINIRICILLLFTRNKVKP